MFTRNFIITKSSLTIVIGAKPYIIDNTHRNFEKIKDAIKANASDESIISLIDVTTSVNEYTQGKIRVANGQVFYKDIYMKNTLTDRMLTMMDEGFNIDSMCKFMDNLHQNPSKTAVDELYLFLEACNLPITEDGHFLAYKKVRHDYKDIHSGSFDNSIGAKPMMDRNMVDDNRNNTCSQGLHFASYSYMAHFGGTSNSDRIVIVKINPADVVSIPSDYNNAKGRCWTYEVVNEVPNDGKTEIKNDCITDKVAYKKVKEEKADKEYSIIKTTVSKGLYSNEITLEDLFTICNEFGFSNIGLASLNFNQVANKIRQEAINHNTNVNEFIDRINKCKKLPELCLKDAYNSQPNQLLNHIKETRIDQYLKMFGGNYKDLVNIPNVDLRIAIETRTPLKKVQPEMKTISIKYDISKYQTLLQLIEKDLKKPNIAVWDKIINKYTGIIQNVEVYKKHNDYKGIINQIRKNLLKGGDLTVGEIY